MLVRSKCLLPPCAAALWAKALAAVVALLLPPLFATGGVSAGVLSCLPGVAHAIEAAALPIVGVGTQAAAGEGGATRAAGDPSISVSLSFFHGLLLACYASDASWWHGDHGRHEVLDQLVGCAPGAAKRCEGLATGQAIRSNVSARLV